jgi:hypothetical protein
MLPELPALLSCRSFDVFCPAALDPFAHENPPLQVTTTPAGRHTHTILKACKLHLQALFSCVCDEILIQLIRDENRYEFKINTLLRYTAGAASASFCFRLRRNHRVFILNCIYFHRVLIESLPHVYSPRNYHHHLITITTHLLSPCIHYHHDRRLPPPVLAHNKLGFDLRSVPDATSLRQFFGMVFISCHHIYRANSISCSPVRSTFFFPELP